MSGHTAQTLSRAAARPGGWKPKFPLCCPRRPKARTGIRDRAAPQIELPPERPVSAGLPIIAFANIAADQDPKRDVRFLQGQLERCPLQLRGAVAAIVAKSLNLENPLPCMVAVVPAVQNTTPAQRYLPPKCPAPAREYLPIRALMTKR